MTTPDPLVLARLEQIGNAPDGVSLIQAYLDLSTFGPRVLPTIVAVGRDEITLAFAGNDARHGNEAVLGGLAYLGRRWPDQLFAALGDPSTVSWELACSIERIDDPRTTEILLAVANRVDEPRASALVPALVRRRDPRVLPLLEHHLFSADREVRLRAARGLGAMFHPDAANAIRAALENEQDAEVRSALTTALTHAG